MIRLEDALRPALDKLRGRYNHRYAKETCIVEMCRQLVMGKGHDNEQFWARDDTPARSTYMKWRKYDGRFLPVLEECREITRRWRTEQSANSVEEALAILQLKAPDAALKIAELISSLEPRISLDAATRLLDRASAITGEKKQQSLHIPDLDAALTKIYGDEEDEEE
jgi:hypothetical protein